MRRMVGSAAAYWDDQAASFDDEPDHGLRHPAVRSAWARLLQSQLPEPPVSVADLGCGTGPLSVLLACAGHAVVGLDIAPRMIEIARTKTAAAGAEARFVVGDAAAPQLPQASFDVVLARHVLWAVGDVEQTLAGWLRLLRPGGRLVLVEGRWHTGAGLTASEAERAVRVHRDEVEVTALDDRELWGGPITDERYLLVSRR
jgi:ubiquinone/menaquinone biosynthesis C-methylase UbiE